MDKPGRIGKKNKTLGTERCETIDILYISKINMVYDIISGLF